MNVTVQPSSPRDGALRSMWAATATTMGRKPFRLKRLLSRSFQADREAPRAARHALDELNGQIDAPLKADIRLLVSEVVTNSVIHAQAARPGEVTLDVWASEDVVRVAVTDRGPGFVAEDSPRGGERSGWGLMMVDRLADRWGVELGDGTEVWFEFARRAGETVGADGRPDALCLQ
jgi:anti-sigma regulatory factor (Ser/Thr protein kinase)